MNESDPKPESVNALFRKVINMPKLSKPLPESEKLLLTRVMALLKPSVPCPVSEKALAIICSWTSLVKMIRDVYVLTSAGP